MITMKINGVIDNVREAKEGAKDAGYSDFIFMGGILNLQLKEEHYKLLKDKEGEQLSCVFKMKPCKTIDRFKKEGIGFEAVEILTIEE